MSKLTISPCVWSDDLLIHHELIDQQHQEIINRINQCVESLNAPHEFSFEEELEVLSLMVFLLDYIVVHFSQEERLMIELDYPHFFAHRMAHTYYISRIFDFKERFKREGLTDGLARDFQKDVIEWLVDHIRREDNRLAAWNQVHQKTRKQSSQS
ncbi:bacteriohemerythrin [Desulfurispira natronophila]|uniref:Hemerythrin n=1 Tax=Desulfurispira natronophila TaxID=682562 RepID=A0A7W7Y648_9BACT|nr:hemerythrin family protein [Desulfurispira natronophila]MBB5022759.1 hemerythrin [Desulfurispira natronophila]